MGSTSHLPMVSVCVHKRKYREQIPHTNAISTVYAVNYWTITDLNARQPLVSLRGKMVSQFVNSSKIFLYWAAGWKHISVWNFFSKCCSGWVCNVASSLVLSQNRLVPTLLPLFVDLSWSCESGTSTQGTDRNAAGCPSSLQVRLRGPGSIRPDDEILLKATMKLKRDTDDFHLQRCGYLYPVFLDNPLKGACMH